LKKKAKKGCLLILLGLFWTLKTSGLKVVAN